MARTTATMNLVGEDGNAFSILARANRALKDAGVSDEERDEFHAAATSGDYDNLLRVTMEWIECDVDDDDY